MRKRKLRRPSDAWRALLTPEDCLDRFKNRLVMLLRDAYDAVAGASSVDADFALRYGHPMPAPSATDYLNLDDPFTAAFDRSLCKQAIENASNLSQICFLIECFLASVQKQSPQSLSRLETAIRDAVQLSPGIRLDMSVHRREISIRPEGDRLLDKHVVDEVLISLEKYPIVSKHFKEALKFYASGEAPRYRNALDNLRFALESLLKKVLSNNKSLENQKPSLLPWLKARGVHSQVVNMYEMLLFGPYSLYQNEAVKHNEAFNVVELEFVIYLTGTFMRLILTLSKPAAGTNSNRS